MSLNRDSWWSGAVRRTALALALATAALAVYASVAGEQTRRDAAASAQEARDYAGVAYLAGRQRHALVATGTTRAAKARQEAALTRSMSRLLTGMASRSGRYESLNVASLVRQHRAAAEAAASALATSGSKARTQSTLRAAGAFAAIESRATRELRERQNAALQRPSTSILATASAIATVLAALAVLLLICLGPLRRRGSRAAPSEDELIRLEAAAKTDSLTGLGNHRSFHHDLSIEVQRRATTGSPFTLMAIDLDGLKQINDTNGHQAGDRYIERVTEAVRRTIGDEGTVYRIGGDEFMVLLPGRRNWHGLALAHRIDEATRAAVDRRALSIGLTESSGTEARHLLVHQADVALYEAKRTQLTVVSYHPGLTADPGAPVVDSPSQHHKALAAALARAVDAKDVGTRSHSETVAELCVGIGRRLGIEGDGLERIRLAGLLHDVGKIGVSDAILQKPAALETVERDEMREHVSIGHGILISAEMPTEAEWVLYHHEHCDGTGYPAGLRASAIPLQSRIIAVADAFEAMTGTRPYSAAISTAEALEELTSHIGTQFDGRCVHALVEVVDEAAATTASERRTASQPGRHAQPVVAPAALATR